MSSVIQEGSAVQSSVASLAADVTARSKAPVFVLGCVRSGTTWLSHMLFSAGNFAVYRAESNVFNVLEPRVGGLASAAHRRELLKIWEPTRMFQRTGLDMAALAPEILENCRNGGDFLRIYMEAMAQQQGVERWVETTPEHILYLEQIQKTIPNALVIHVIRDGRDVALSTEKQKWIRPLPWDKGGELSAAAVFWEWMVQRGRRDGKKLGANYREVRYEDLVLRPHETLASLSTFVGQKMDYDEILKVGIGSVSKPNTSFGQHDDGAAFNPLGRWKQALPAEKIVELEAVLGPTLTELGYPLVTTDAKALDRPDLRRKRALYKAYFDTKHALKGWKLLSPLLVTHDLSWLG